MEALAELAAEPAEEPPSDERVAEPTREPRSDEMALAARVAGAVAAPGAGTRLLTTGTERMALAIEALAEPTAEPAEEPPSGERVAELAKEPPSDVTARDASVAGAASASAAAGLLSAGTERTRLVMRLGACASSVTRGARKLCRAWRRAIVLPSAFCAGTRSLTMVSMLVVNAEIG